ncbi:MAG: GatB/YqeY domain-containing protein [Gammaproteobacteria bacterium]|nr:GatB/YqeY domain-containing protein [Gammaproteobacteria bacterium]
MSETRQQILEDIKVCMKAGDKERLATLRLISAAIKQKEVDERIELDETQTIAILDKMLKQRRESIAQYQKADRNDLVSVEEAEISIIQTYMPEAMDEDEINTIIDDAIKSTGAATIKDMGKVMGKVKPIVQGRADMATISTQIKARLSG